MIREPQRSPTRQRVMTKHLRMLLTLLVALTLLGAACGSDETVDVGSAGGDDADSPVDTVDPDALSGLTQGETLERVA